MAIPVSLDEKLQLLAAYMAKLLEANPTPQDAASLKVDTRYRHADDPQYPAAHRKAVMGDPAWYLEVLDTGENIAVIQDQELRYMGGIDFFRISVFLQYIDADQDEDSSTFTWRKIIWGDGEGTEPPGLLTALRCLGINHVAFRTKDGDQLRLRQPEETVNDLLPVGEVGESVHWVTFRIGVEEML